MGVRPKRLLHGQKRYDEKTAHQRGYNRRWQKLRRQLFMCANGDADNPEVALCEDCLAEGEEREAEELHHIVKGRAAPELFYDKANLMPLCVRHHKIRTGRGE